MNEKKFLRKCIFCAEFKKRNELVKITVNKLTNDVKVNPDTNFFGRSAYICKDIHCIDGAFKKGRLYKILKIKPDDTLNEKIRAVLEE